MRITLNAGINGGWYGEVSTDPCDSLDDLEADAELLQEILTRLRAADPLREARTKAKPKPKVSARAPSDLGNLSEHADNVLALIRSQPGLDPETLHTRAGMRRETFEGVTRELVAAHRIAYGPGPAGKGWYPL